MEKHRIIGIHLANRLDEAVNVQGLLTQYGKVIRTRIGLHDTYENSSAQTQTPGGIILAELAGDDRPCDELIQKLGSLRGVEVKEMTFMDR